MCDMLQVNQNGQSDYYASNVTKREAFTKNNFKVQISNYHKHVALIFHNSIFQF